MRRILSSTRNICAAFAAVSVTAVSARRDNEIRRLLRETKACDPLTGDELHDVAPVTKPGRHRYNRKPQDVAPRSARKNS